jgi:integrase
LHIIAASDKNCCGIPQIGRTDQKRKPIHRSPLLIRRLSGSRLTLVFPYLPNNRVNEPCVYVEFFHNPVHPHMLESSGDLRLVQELLGHANISTTEVYTHLDFQYLAKVYDKAHPRTGRKKDDEV